MLRYLGKRLLVVIFKVLRIDVEMIVVCGEGLRALGNTGNKLFHLHQKTIALPVVLKGSNRDIGWGHTI